MTEKGLMILFLVIAFAVCAQADTYNGEIEYTAGSGSNEATIVIDFDLDDFFMFTYSWEGEAMGWDALDALDTAGDLYVDSTWFEDWQSHFINDFDYPGGVEYDYSADGFPGWHYYGSSDNENWSQNTGVDYRILNDGDWDSWVWTNYDQSWLPLRGPGEAPVPEPMTFGLLGLGGLMLRRRKGRR
ncbi:PEP-CTERM sorting domain-containing protein [Planctomycetota bacterium]